MKNLLNQLGKKFSYEKFIIKLSPEWEFAIVNCINNFSSGIKSSQKATETHNGHNPGREWFSMALRLEIYGIVQKSWTWQKKRLTIACGPQNSTQLSHSATDIARKKFTGNFYEHSIEIYEQYIFFSYQWRERNWIIKKATYQYIVTDVKARQ